ncbi:MAG: hypothetical protein WBF20_16150 [Trebonia sp.]|uniref:hypothetical protein n=1 Tax=Trebonia sp. TaxID=2767075 RepID=UPI003BCAA1CC
MARKWPAPGQASASAEATPRRPRLATYSIPVSYTVTRAEPGTIEVFESSPKNGQPVNVQLIPVTLAP